MEGAAFPTSPEDITPTWLTSALRAGGLPDARVETVSLERLGEERGLTAITLRLRITGSDTPASVVAKLPLAAPEARQRMRELGTYRREVRFYGEFGNPPPMRVPHAYFAQQDEAEGAFVLLLEDLGDYHFPNDGEGKVDEVALALRSVATMHAAYWGSLSLPDWLASEESARTIAANIVGTRERYEERMGGVSPLIGEIVDRLPAAVEAGRLQMGLPATLCHGDFSVKNLCFGHGEVVAFDWQIASRRECTRDVALAVLRSLPAHELAANLGQLLGEYQGALKHNGISLPMTTLREGFFREVLGALVGTVAIVVLPPSADAARITTSRRTWHQVEQLLEFFDPLKILAGS